MNEFMNDLVAFILKSKCPVFFLSDLVKQGEKSFVIRTLQTMLKKEQLIRVGYGIYVRAKVSSINKKIIPEILIREIAIVYLERTGAQVVMTEFERNYNNGTSTQIPTGRVIGVDRPIKRKISFNGRQIHFQYIKKREI